MGKGKLSPVVSLWGHSPVQKVETMKVMSDEGDEW